MSTATERVAEFLRQWAMGRDKSDVIYGVHFDPNGEMADLLASDLRDILEDLATCREILSTPTERSTVTVGGRDFQAAVPADTEARFYDLGNNSIGVHADDAGFIYVDASPLGLEVVPMSRGVLRVAVAK